jgi:hypothetical protein
MSKFTPKQLNEDERWVVEVSWNIEPANPNIFDGFTCQDDEPETNLGDAVQRSYDYAADESRRTEQQIEWTRFNNLPAYTVGKTMFSLAYLEENQS